MMKTLIRVLMLLFPTLLWANPPKPVKPPVPPRPVKATHAPKPVKLAHPVKAQKPGKTVKFDDATIETAPEHAQKPVEAKQAPERNSLIQNKKDMRGAILKSGSSY
jgi:hypothetical protein